MRLLTHNYLKSTVKGTEKGFPLIIEATKIEYEESHFNLEFVKKLLQKLDYQALVTAIRQIAPSCTDIIQLPELPDSIDGLIRSEDDDDDDEDKQVDLALLKQLHTVLFDVHVVEGTLVCPDTGRRFPIKMGIPNMILHEDEI
jgi:multifunctional methyltransferase subunit TRM112